MCNESLLARSFVRVHHACPMPAMADELTHRIGANIRAARKHHGLTQEQLAEAVHTSRAHVVHWERGDYAPSRVNLALLADVLEVHLGWFLDIHDEEPDATEPPEE